MEDRTKTWPWQVTQTLHPTVRRAYGKRTRPHTFYRVFAEREEAFAFYRELDRRYKNVRYAIQQVNPLHFEPTPEGTWIDTRAPERAKARKARRDEQKELDSKTGFKAVRTRPTALRAPDFAVGQRVRVVHVTKTFQRIYPETLGRQGVVSTVWRWNSVAVRFDGDQSDSLMKTTQLEIITP